MAGGFWYSELMLMYVLGFAVICLLQLAMYLPGAWSQRKYIAWPILICQVAYIVVVGIKFAPIAAVLFALFGIYSVFNLAKVIGSNSQPKYLFRTTLKTTLWIIGIQAAILLTNYLTGGVNVSIPSILTVIVLAQALMAIYIVFVLKGNLDSAKIRDEITAIPSSTLPSITVAIPARNETTDLEQCLNSLIASKYPKLEIIVLDDNSQSTKTPEIIRSYAHDGVLFVAGKEVPDGWLAKNFAYQQLVDHSNGEIFIFCGVDTRFSEDALNGVVEYLKMQKLEMLSIVPRNEAVKPGRFQSLLLQPARYAWELCLPRDSSVNPPTLSTVWAISKKTLAKHGGFKAVKHTVFPEKYFARSINKQKYGFVLSNSAIDISSKKKLDEQYSTSIRTRYPALHKRCELVALISFAELTFLIAPVLVAINGFIFGFWTTASVATLAALIQFYIYGRVITITYRKTSILGYIVMPVAVLYDIYLLNYSMWLYEFREVLWKGRNVALPVMHVEAKLPDIT